MRISLDRNSPSIEPRTVANDETIIRKAPHFEKSNVAWMELNFYGKLDNQSGCCCAWKEISSALGCVRRLSAVERPVGDGADNRVRCFLDYGSYDFQIGRNGKKFYCTFNHFKLVGFTFKFRLRITHQKIFKPPNFGVAIYIVSKLITR